MDKKRIIAIKKAVLIIKNCAKVLILSLQQFRTTKLITDKW